MLHGTERLGEDVGQLLVGVDIGELDLLCFYFLPQPVILDVEVLSSFGQAWARKPVGAPPVYRRSDSLPPSRQSPSGRTTDGERGNRGKRAARLIAARRLNRKC